MVNPQQHHQQRVLDDPAAAEAPGPLAAPRAGAQDGSLDAFLDEIDSVLETDAQEFVAGFVQKGGQ